jgi:hypothetical protein
MPLAQKVEALLHGVTRRDLERMKPEQRRKLALALRRIADIADPPAYSAPPKSGVLCALYSGERAL